MASYDLYSIRQKSDEDQKFYLIIINGQLKHGGVILLPMVITILMWPITPAYTEEYLTITFSHLEHTRHRTHMEISWYQSNILKNTWLKVSVLVEFNNPSSNNFQIFLSSMSYGQSCQTMCAFLVLMGQWLCAGFHELISSIESRQWWCQGLQCSTCWFHLAHILNLHTNARRDLSVRFVEMDIVQLPLNQLWF